MCLLIGGHAVKLDAVKNLCIRVLTKLERDVPNICRSLEGKKGALHLITNFVTQ